MTHDSFLSLVGYRFGATADEEPIEPDVGTSPASAVAPSSTDAPPPVARSILVD
jgi:hypothetical protein